MAPRTLLARSARPVSVASLACAAMLAVGCSGEVVNLGSSLLQAGGSAAAGAGGVGGGGAAHELWNVQAEPVLMQEKGVLLANPTLTAAMDELYCSSQQRGGDPNPVLVERAVRVGGRWGALAQLSFGDAGMPDAASPAISADGQELWLGMNTSGSTDIFHSVRQSDTAWSPPSLVAELNSPLDDVPRPPGQGGLVMPLSSKRHGGSPALYQIYFSTRSSSDAPWGTPSQTWLGAIDSSEFQSADGFLTDDGLKLYFSSTRDGEHQDSDLYVARRETTDVSFGEPEPLVDLNDPASEERMPWLSPDGQRLYFASDRSGEYGLYVAERLP